VKKLIVILSIFAIYLPSFSQDTTGKKSDKESKKQAKKQKVNDLIRQDEEGILVYSKQSVFGFQLRTNGYGFFIEKGTMKTQSKTNLYSFEFNETKHPKQDKLPNGSGGFTFGNPYIYGKVNNFYSVQLGFGQQKMLGQKGNKNGVALSAVYKGGLTIGLLRPYYIQVEDNLGVIREIKYTQEDSALFVSGYIIGAGSFGKGWGELKFKPGLFAKGGLRFDYGRFNEVVSAVEVGVSAEFYSSTMPIMLFQDDKQFFFQGHITLMFGHRK
jgi:hypothetical protein